MAPAPKPEKVTLKTVARAVGVSPATISNAYNRPEKLSAALRERVLATARELGYAGPDPAARRLRRGRAGSIGLLFGEQLSYVFADPGAVAFLRGLAEGTARHNAVLQLIAALDADGAEGGEELVANAIVDGLVVWSLPDRHPLLRAARERGIPLVTHGGPRLDGVPFVGIDDRAAARAAAEHVVGLGHRRVGIVAFPFGPRRAARERDAKKPGRPAYRVTRERLAGFRDVLGDRGPIAEVAVNDRAEGRRAARALLAGAARRRPTALLAMSDELAFGALDAARELGLAVPGDLSVTGFDGAPALTTVAQSLHEQGRLCAQRLIAATHGEPVPAGLAAWSLRAGPSTGPPRP